jgi:hypothetical protein
MRNTMMFETTHGATQRWRARAIARSAGFFGVVALVSSAAACAAPFSEMQSARLAGPRVVELTPSYSHVDVSAEGESSKLQDNFGLHVATGLNSRVDLRFRLEHIRGEDNNSEDDLELNATAVGFGPKFGIIPDQLALALPVGFAFGDDIDVSDTWQIHPTLIWTIPVSDAFEINSSVKALVPLSDGPGDALVALNLGLGIGPQLSRWAIRPEVGFLRDPGEDGTIRHFSIGMTFYLGREGRRR